MSYYPITNKGTVPKVKYASPFIDVPQSNKQHPMINALYHMKIVKGYKTSKGQQYRPSSKITREEFSQMLYILMTNGGDKKFVKPKKSPYKDVSTSRGFYTAITWMYNKKIATGHVKSGKRYFSPTSTITEETVAIMLYRAFADKTYKVPTKSPFADVKKSSSVSYKAMCWMYSKGFTKGYTNSKKKLEYRPKTAITRGTTAVYLHRYQTLKKTRKAPSGTTKYALKSSIAPKATGTITFNNLVAKRFSIAHTCTGFDEVKKIGWEKWFNNQFALTSKNDTAWLAPYVKHLPVLNTDTYNTDKGYLKAMKTPIDSSGRALAAVQRIGGTFLRAVNSPRVINESLTNFWLDHFSVPYEGGGAPAVTSMDLWMRDKAGTTVYEIFWNMFRSLKIYSFLNGDTNAVGAVNENLAREMIELYTTGITTGVEEDIRQLAILLTGHRNAWSSYGDLTFNDKLHVYTKTPLKILGRSYPNATSAQARASIERIVYDLTYDDRTIKFISTKLASHFVQDAPTSAMVSEVMETYRRTGGSIKDMLRTIIVHPDFVKNIGSKWMRPFEIAASHQRNLVPKIDETALTATLAKRTSYRILFMPCDQIIYRLGTAGHYPRNNHSPKGYSNLSKDWLNSSSILQSFNFVSQQASLASRTYKITTTWAKVLGATSDNVAYATRADRMFEQLTGFVPSRTHTKIVQNILADKKVPWATRVENASARILLSPYNFMK